MKDKSSIYIILAAVCITGGVYLTISFTRLELDFYLAAIALVGGAVAILLGYRFLRAYLGKTGRGHETYYANLHTYEYPVAKGKVSLYYELPEKDHVRLVLLNLEGKEVKELIDEEQESGEYPIDFETSDIPDGTYFYELTTSNQRKAKKIIIYNS